MSVHAFWHVTLAVNAQHHVLKTNHFTLHVSTLPYNVTRDKIVSKCNVLSHISQQKVNI